MRNVMLDVKMQFCKNEKNATKILFRVLWYYKMDGGCSSSSSFEREKAVFPFGIFRKTWQLFLKIEERKKVSVYAIYIHSCAKTMILRRI